MGPWKSVNTIQQSSWRTITNEWPGRGKVVATAKTTDVPLKHKIALEVARVKKQTTALCFLLCWGQLSNDLSQSIRNSSYSYWMYPIRSLKSNRTLCSHWTTTADAKHCFCSINSFIWYQASKLNDCKLKKTKTVLQIHSCEVLNNPHGFGYLKLRPQYLLDGMLW